MYFEEKTLKMIYNLVSKKLLVESGDVFKTQKDVEDGINAVAELMLIEDSLILFNENTKNRFEAVFPYMDGVDVINPEGFLKKLLRVVEPNKLNAANKQEWMMGQLYSYFQLYDRYDEIKNQYLNFEGKFVLSACSPNLFHGQGKLREEYCAFRWERNEAEHAYWTYLGEEITPTLAMEVYMKMWTVMVDMCGRYKDVIHKTYVRQVAAKSFDAKGYAEKIVENYEDRAEKYLYVSWCPLDVNVDSTPLNIVQLVRKQKNSNMIKLIGCAGVGKTESMRYAAYIRAKDYLREKHDIPIYIPLIDVQEKNMTIMELIQETLGLSHDETEAVLEAKKIVFFLDGYNEVLDPEMRKSTAFQINALREKYLNKKFVLSDRSKNTSPACPREKTYCYQLEPLREDLIKKYFERNADEGTYTQIMKCYDEKLKWLESCDSTPYMLNVLIEMFQAEEEIPMSQDAFYVKELEFKLKREETQKLDYRIPALKECLKELTQKLTYGEYANISVIQKSFRDSGIDLERALGYVELCTGLDILEENDEGKLGWKNLFYFSYFFYEYMK